MFVPLLPPRFPSGSTVRLDHSIIHGYGLIIYGHHNTIRAGNSRITGDSNTIDAHSVTVIGNNNTIQSHHAKITGNSNTIDGRCVKVIGHSNALTGKYGNITGHRNRVNGDHATVKGDDNQVTGKYCKIEGHRNRMIGDHCSAKGDANRMVGNHCSVKGRCNHVTGENASANGGDSENTVNGLLADQERDRRRVNLQNQIDEMMGRQQELSIPEQIDLHDLQMNMLDLQHTERREQHHREMDRLNSVRGSFDDLRHSLAQHREAMRALHEMEMAHHQQQMEAMQNRNALVNEQTNQRLAEIAENMRQVRPDLDVWVDCWVSTTTNGPKIVLNLRGEDEEYDEDTDLIGAKCLCCWCNQANVAAACCGKLIACMACTKTLYEDKSVGSANKCLSCQAAVEECVRIHF